MGIFSTNFNLSFNSSSNNETNGYKEEEPKWKRETCSNCRYCTRMDNFQNQPYYCKIKHTMINESDSACSDFY